MLRLIGTPPIWIASAPMIPPSKMPSPTNVISVALVGRSIYPSSFAADSTSFFRPTNSRVSPQSIVVCAKTGISIPARLIRRILTPCIKLWRRMKSNFWLKYGFLCIMTGSTSTGKSSSWGSTISSPIQSSSPMANSLLPLSTTSSPFCNNCPGIISLTMEDPCRILSTNNLFPCEIK